MVVCGRAGRAGSGGLKLNECVWAVVRQGRGQQGPLRGCAWDLWIFYLQGLLLAVGQHRPIPAWIPALPWGLGTHRRPEAGAAAWRRSCRRPPLACRRRPALLPVSVAGRRLLMRMPLYTTATGWPGRPWSERSAACPCGRPPRRPVQTLAGGVSMFRRLQARVLQSNPCMGRQLRNPAPRPDRHAACCHCSSWRFQAYKHNILQASKHALVAQSAPKPLVAA